MKCAGLITRAIAVAIAVVLPFGGRAKADSEEDFQSLGKSFVGDVMPLAERYCLDCHDAETKKGELDLERFAHFSEVRKDPKTWQNVLFQLESGEMPPKDKRQLSADERMLLIDWVKRYLHTEARAQAGDPGPVVIRRLSNAEYTFTIHDLTGIQSLAPAREFPVDGAAGEGFTNVGDALPMSPALVGKYLDAAKEVAEHAVLLPDGIEFSRFTTQRDKTTELIAQIKEIYHRHTYAIEGGDLPANLEGIKLTNRVGGLLPIGKYFAATRSGPTSKLSPKYLALLESMLTGTGGPGDPLFDPIRKQWLQASSPKDAAALAEQIAIWQGRLWKFNNIGHVGHTGGPENWQDPVDPLSSRREFTLSLLPAKERRTKDLRVFLAVTDAGDGSSDDRAIWENPRLTMSGEPDIPLHVVASLKTRLDRYRREVLSRTEHYLAAAAVALEATEWSANDLDRLARDRELDVGTLRSWLNLLRVGGGEPVQVDGHYVDKFLSSTAGQEFIQGWGTHATPSIGANSSDQDVGIPGTARARKVFCHPSAAHFTAAGWQSPISGQVSIEASLGDTHGGCGNGIEWILQYRTSLGATNLWSGTLADTQAAIMNPRTIWINKGELLALMVGPKAGDHGCDLTSIDLTITEVSGAKRRWDLGKDVSADIVAANPHDDLHGNEGVWHFFKGEMKSVAGSATGRGVGGIPPRSLLARWLDEKDDAKRALLASRVAAMLAGREQPSQPEDVALLEQLHAMASGSDLEPLLEGLEPDPRFEGASLRVTAPSLAEFSIPASLARGRQLVATGVPAGANTSVQFWVSKDSKPEVARGVIPGAPVTVTEGSPARARFEAAFDAFRELFPIAVCYERVVPIDEVVTLQLWHREDHFLRSLILDEVEMRALDRLWEKLYFVAREPLEYLDAFDQITEFATQDRPDLVEGWKAHRKPTEERAAAFRKRLLDTEPIHLESVLDFAERAWRRPLVDEDKEKLRGLYQTFRGRKLVHEAALRLTLARVLVAPDFLYRTERPASGQVPAPVTDLELATRLSYFLWSSLPDSELRQVAEAGQLSDPATLTKQTKRLLSDARIRRLAVQFGCQWLGVRGFDQLDEKSERHFPEFKVLRGPMYEETIRFFTHLFQSDGSLLSLLNADHTFVNGELAKFYGLPDSEEPNAWHRVDGLQKQERGGILGLATTLAKQSGASRTSPILRGNWISETLLGERLPKPPRDVPQLPEEVPAGLSERELIAKHSADPACAKCHAKIDPYGFALEDFDAIGKWRGNSDTKAELPDGTSIEGLDGLRSYLLKDRRDAFVRHVCHKLLGFSLGRAVQLSDEPLLDEMMKELEAKDYRFGVAVEAIVLSPQFREIRGRKQL